MQHVCYKIGDVWKSIFTETPLNFRQKIAGILQTAMTARGSYNAKGKLYVTIARDGVNKRFFIYIKNCFSTITLYE